MWQQTRRAWGATPQHGAPRRSTGRRATARRRAAARGAALQHGAPRHSTAGRAAARRADGCIVGPMSGTAGCKWAHLNTYACNCVSGRERCLREYLILSHAACASIRYSRTQRERLILAHRVLVRTRVKARTLVVSSVRRRGGPIRRAGARGPARPSVGRVCARCHQVFPTHACKTKANQRGTRPAWIHFSASRK